MSRTRVTSSLRRRVLFLAGLTVGFILALPNWVVAEVHRGEVSFDDVVRPDNHEFWGSVVNFLLLLGLIVFFGRKNVGRFLENRKTHLTEEMNEAQALKEESEARYRECMSRLECLDQEMADLKAEVLNAAKLEKDRIIQAAEERIARMEADFEFVAGQKTTQLRMDLSREVVQVSLGAAEQEIARELTDQDKSRLQQRYVDALGNDARAVTSSPGSTPRPLRPRVQP